MTIQLALLFFAVCACVAAYVIGFQLGRNAGYHSGWCNAYKQASKCVDECQMKVIELRQWIHEHAPQRPKPEKDAADWWKEEE